VTSSGDPFRDSTIENWVGDFLEAPAGREPGRLVREYAPEVLTVFLGAACRVRDLAPDQIEEGDLKPALLEGVGGLEIPASVREDVPALCAAFLAEMEAQGRLGGGRTLALYVRALRRPYLDATSEKGTTIVAPAPKVGRNDPCPCGSGLKYKKCCMRRLDS